MDESAIPDGDDFVQYHVRHVLRKWHRVMFSMKIRAVTNDLLERVEVDKVDYCHAHYLFSDGAVALGLKRRFGIPFIVSVRSTDLNTFMRLRPDLLGRMYEIVRSAERVVFFCPAYQARFLEQVPESVRTEVAPKSMIIPNGVSRFWLESAPSGSRKSDGILRILTVGDLTRNKNVEGLIRATTIIAHNRRVRLSIVGGTSTNVERVKKFAMRIGAGELVEFHGRILDRERLRVIYRQQDVFVMISFRETFGVVFIEALSQGIPVVYTRGEAIDGLFESETVAEAVNPADARNVASGINRVALRMKRRTDDCVQAARAFDWDDIARRFESLYENC